MQARKRQQKAPYIEALQISPPKKSEGTLRNTGINRRY